jgi:hypothetical protein
MYLCYLLNKYIYFLIDFNNFYILFHMDSRWNPWNLVHGFHMDSRWNDSRWNDSMESTWNGPWIPGGIVHGFHRGVSKFLL